MTEGSSDPVETKTVKVAFTIGFPSKPHLKAVGGVVTPEALRSIYGGDIFDCEDLKCEQPKGSPGTILYELCVRMNF